MDMKWFSEAFDVIRRGMADKLSKDGITVYRVKDIIRIDIKEARENE